MRAFQIIPIARRFSPLVWLAAACAAFVVVMAALVTALLNYRDVITPVEPAPPVWRKLETALDLPSIGSAGEELRVLEFSGWNDRIRAYVIARDGGISVDVANAAGNTRFLTASFTRHLEKSTAVSIMTLLSGLKALEHEDFGCEIFDAARYEIEGFQAGGRFEFKYDGCSDHPVPAINQLLDSLGGQ